MFGFLATEYDDFQIDIGAEKVMVTIF